MVIDRGHGLLYIGQGQVFCSFLQCDGQDLTTKVQEMKLHCLLFLNIPRWVCMVWIFLFCIDTTLENIAISSDRHGCVMSWYQQVIKNCKIDYFISKLYFWKIKPLHIWVIHIYSFLKHCTITFILKILFVIGMQVERYPGEILTLQDLNHSAMTTGIWRW